MPDKKKSARFAVYDPPAQGFPFLAVMIGPDGDVVSAAYETAEEAEAHNLHHATELQRLVDGETS